MLEGNANKKIPRSLGKRCDWHFTKDVWFPVEENVKPQFKAYLIMFVIEYSFEPPLQVYITFVVHTIDYSGALLNSS